LKNTGLNQYYSPSSANLPQKGKPNGALAQSANAVSNSTTANNMRNLQLATLKGAAPGAPGASLSPALPYFSSPQAPASRRLSKSQEQSLGLLSSSTRFIRTWLRS